MDLAGVVVDVPDNWVGLLIATEIMESHGGRLHLRSEEGRGTEVELRFPAPVASGSVSPPKISEKAVRHAR